VAPRSHLTPPKTPKGVAPRRPRFAPVLEPSDTASVRMLWPFARYLEDYELELSILRDAGVDPATFADPDARIEHALARKLIVASLEKTGDPCIGLHAGECVEIADFGPIDQLTRNCSTLRDAILLGSRYARLLDDGVWSTLEEHEHSATVSIHNQAPNRPWLINEFQLVSTLKRLSSFVREPIVPLEVHVMHERVTDAAEYARVFRAPVRCGAEHNALVIRREVLDIPPPHPNPALIPVFDRQATAALKRLGRSDSFTDKVRRLMRGELERGLTAAGAARRLSVSEATLRRRLVKEGTTYQRVLDAVRMELAFSLQEAKHEPAEISAILGFSSRASFARAFRRWMASLPTSGVDGE
jgi:AraC-like DNA-binding protein